MLVVLLIYRGRMCSFAYKVVVEVGIIGVFSLEFGLCGSAAEAIAVAIAVAIRGACCRSSRLLRHGDDGIRYPQRATSNLADRLLARNKAE